MAIENIGNISASRNTRMESALGKPNDHKNTKKLMNETLETVKNMIPAVRKYKKDGYI